MNTVHVLLPEGVDDPARPSGGNVYDRRVCDGLRARGWRVGEHEVSGSWPEPSADLAGLATRLGSLGAGELVLVDGLIGSAAAAVLVPAADRQRIVPLIHLPLDTPGELAVLAASAAVVVTSEWTRRRLGPLSAPVFVAPPGVDPAPLTSPSDRLDRPARLLDVGAVIPAKGHDLLLTALRPLAGLPWRLDLVGTLQRDPAHVGRLRVLAGRNGIADRVAFRGPLVGAELDRAFAEADLLVHPSRGETYGMVITEALARGLPVVATAVGGVGEAMQGGGVLVAPDDPAALAASLRAWLTDPARRGQLRQAALARRATLTGWEDTAAAVADALHAAGEVRAA